MMQILLILLGWFIGYFLGFFLPFFIYQLVQINEINKRIKEREKLYFVNKLSFEEKRRIHENARNKT